MTARPLELAARYTPAAIWHYLWLLGVAMAVLLLAASPFSAYVAMGRPVPPAMPAVITTDALSGGQLTLMNYTFSSWTSIPPFVRDSSHLSGQGTSLATVNGRTRLALTVTGTSTYARNWTIFGFQPQADMNITFAAEYTGAYASAGMDIWMGSWIDPLKASGFHVLIGYQQDKAYYYSGANAYQFTGKTALAWHYYTIHLRSNYTYDFYRDGALLRAYILNEYKNPAIAYAPMYSSWYLNLQFAPSAGAGNFYIDFLQESVAQRPLTPVLPTHMAVMFDDGDATTATVAAPTMAQYGWTGTSLINGATVGNATFTKETWTQIRNLYLAGWEIGDHSYNHVDLLTLSLSKAEANISQGRSTIIENVTDIPTTWAPPGWSYNSTLDNYAYGLGMSSRDVVLPSYPETSSYVTGTYTDSRIPVTAVLFTGTPASITFHVISNSTCSTCTSWIDWLSVLTGAKNAGFRLVPYTTLRNELAVLRTLAFTTISLGPSGYSFQYTASSLGKVDLLDASRIFPAMARIGETNATTTFGTNGNVTIQEIGAGTYQTAITIGGSASLAGARVVVTRYQPNLLVGSVLEFTTHAVPAGEKYLNVSGLRPNAFYNVSVDGVVQFTLETSDAGALAFTWSSWSDHAFAVSFSHFPAVPSLSFDQVQFLVFVLLFAALVLLLVLAYKEDSAVYLIPAGAFVFFLAFQAWTATASWPATVALVAVGLIVLAVPVERLASSR